MTDWWAFTLYAVCVASMGLTCWAWSAVEKRRVRNVRVSGLRGVDCASVDIDVRVRKG